MAGDKKKAKKAAARAKKSAASVLTAEHAAKATAEVTGDPAWTGVEYRSMGRLALAASVLAIAGDDPASLVHHRPLICHVDMQLALTLLPPVPHMSAQWAAITSAWRRRSASGCRSRSLPLCGKLTSSTPTTRPKRPTDHSGGGSRTGLRDSAQIIGISKGLAIG